MCSGLRREASMRCLHGREGRGVLHQPADALHETPVINDLLIHYFISYLPVLKEITS